MNITWRTTKIRGRYARGDMSISLTEHAGRKPQLRLGFRQSFMKKNPCEYVAISDFADDPDKIYFRLSHSRRTEHQNKLHRNGNTGSTQVLFTLKKGEEDIIRKWCGKTYNLEKICSEIYCIEREVTNE